VCQTLCAGGYVEDVTFSNVKLLLGSVAVAIAAACNLLSAPFPASMAFSQWSVVLYFLLHVAIQALHFLLPRHCVLITKPRKLIPDDPHSAALDPVKRRNLLKSTKPSPHTHTSPPLILTSHLPRYSTHYTLGLGQKGTFGGGTGHSGGGGGGGVGVSAVRELEVTDFFDQTGVFLKEKFEAEVRGLIDEVERLEGEMSKGKVGKIKGQ
jgi:hypothetical protein